MSGELLLYWKMWQDSECVGVGYKSVIITEDQKRKQIEHDLSDCTNGEYPVFEPWLITKEEFENLEEFEGY